jgi:MFS transporter, NNP family, nitrate/nitrite transporter
LVLLGALANSIALELHLSDAGRGFLVAVPLLGGAVLRLVFGLLADRVGSRRVGICGLVLTTVPLLLGWLWADDFASLLLVGILLGVAGASFAVALPLASRWYPPQYQGLAMGIAAAGNSGTALATFFAPRLAHHLGWHAVFGLALIPVSLTLLVFILTAKDSPNQPPVRPLSDYAAVLRKRDTWYFCQFYAVTFGGFVGLAGFLGVFFNMQYDLTPIQAGTLTTLCVIAGSFLRPLGGYVADRIGGISLLLFLYGGVSLLLLDLATTPPLVWGTILTVLIMGLLGLGNGAVFQLVPLRFPREIGVVTGIVGAAGGVGGFFLPVLLGSARQCTDGFALGLVLCAAVACSSLIALVRVRGTWEGTFVGKGGCVADGQAAEAPAAFIVEGAPLQASSANGRVQTEFPV